MDQGHYNCRDYYVSPHFATPNHASEGPRPAPLGRHESFDELEQRCRSPASRKPKFPLLKLPLELRQQILGYLLPHTQEFRDSGMLGEHARNFSAVKKRGAKGMAIPCGAEGTGAAAAAAAARATAGVSNVVWSRGNIALFGVCKQLHAECAHLVYGTNTFLLFVTFNGVAFRFRWLLPSGLAPSRSYPFLQLMPARYLRLVKKVVVHVDHVDSYTGMIKFNVGGKGLTHGLRKQVQKLVDALSATSDDADGDGGDRRLGRVDIRVSNGNAVLDALKSDAVRQREGGIRVSEDLEEMLEPFGDLRGVRDAHVAGAVTDSFAKHLEDKMQSCETDRLKKKMHKETGAKAHWEDDVRVCVYGNDL